MSRIILDTNVPVKASAKDCPVEELDLQEACIDYIYKLTRAPEMKLVLDLDYEIMREYRNNVERHTPMGQVFWKWLDRYYSTILPEDHVKQTAYY